MATLPRGLISSVGCVKSSERTSNYGDRWCVPKTRRTLRLRHCGAEAIKRGEALAAFATKHGLTDEATVWQRQFEHLAK